MFIYEVFVIVYFNKEYDFIEKIILVDYVFEYGVNYMVIFLGYGMLFNYLYILNVMYEINFDNYIFDFYVYMDI